MNRCFLKPPQPLPKHRELPLVSSNAPLDQIDDDMLVVFPVGEVKAAMLSLLVFEDPDDAERFAHKFLCSLLGLRNMERDDRYDSD